ncbi:hypothetical protein JCM8547_005401 [Rhodosporidiobolus lusitaniae]
MSSTPSPSIKASYRPGPTSRRRSASPNPANLPPAASAHPDPESAISPKRARPPLSTLQHSPVSSATPAASIAPVDEGALERLPPSPKRRRLSPPSPSARSRAVAPPPTEAEKPIVSPTSQPTDSPRHSPNSLSLNLLTHTLSNSRMPRSTRVFAPPLLSSHRFA